MFFVNSVTFTWTQSGICHVVPQGLLIQKGGRGGGRDSPFYLLILRQKKQRPGSFILLRLLNVQTPKTDDWRVKNKCPFNITLLFKREEKNNNFKRGFMLMSSLIGIRKNCFGIWRGSKISQKRKSKIKPSKGLFQRNYSVL